jgi:hypothetical protein
MGKKSVTHSLHDVLDHESLSALDAAHGATATAGLARLANLAWRGLLAEQTGAGQDTISLEDFTFLGEVLAALGTVATATAAAA